MNTSPRIRLQIPESILQAMQDQALRELPNECCGMLGGVIDHDQETAKITHCYPLMNIAESPIRFSADAKELLLVQRQMRRDEVDLLVIYHSHPTSDPIPSQTDLRENFYGSSVACLILGMKSNPPEVRIWRLREEGVEEVVWA